MVKSMTGYGRARETRNKRDITVEVRSVNNRYLDCTVKLPRAYVFAEDAIKGRVQKAVSRGKVDVFVTIDSSGADVSVVKVNEPLARSYYEALLRLKETFGLSGEVTPVELSRCPDVLSVTKAEEDLETLAEDICQVTDAKCGGREAGGGYRQPGRYHRAHRGPCGGTVSPDGVSLPGAAGEQDAGGAGLHHHR